jgi:hypothetical protein
VGTPRRSARSARSMLRAWRISAGLSSRSSAFASTTPRQDGLHRGLSPSYAVAGSSASERRRAGSKQSSQSPMGDSHQPTAIEPSNGGLLSGPGPFLGPQDEETPQGRQGRRCSVARYRAVLQAHQAEQAPLRLLITRRSKVQSFPRN